MKFAAPENLHRFMSSEEGNVDPNELGCGCNGRHSPAPCNESVS
jgi:hypothetical protein